MMDIRKFIHKRIDDYKQALSKNTFKMLFSEEPLSFSKVDKFYKQFYDESLKYATTLAREHKSSEVAELMFVVNANITFTNGNQYFNLIYTANHIYIDADNYIDIGNKYKLSYIENEDHTKKDMVILSKNNVVTNFGFVKDDTIIWDNKLVLLYGLYLKFPVPDEDLSDKALSAFVLSKLNDNTDVLECISIDFTVGKK